MSRDGLGVRGPVAAGAAMYKLAVTRQTRVTLSCLLCGDLSSPPRMNECESPPGCAEKAERSAAAAVGEKLPPQRMSSQA